MGVSWRKHSYSQKGFTLFEVVIAGVIAIIFFLLVLQASTLNTVSKSQTKEATEVLSWLQKDIEFVKSQASMLQLATLRAAVQGDKNVYLNRLEDEMQFQDGDIIEFMNSNPDGVRYTINKIGNKLDGTFRIAQKLKTTYPANSSVIVRSRQQAAVTTAIPKGSKIVYLSDTSGLDTDSELMFGEVNDLSLNPDISQDAYKVDAVSPGVVTIKKPLNKKVDVSNTLNVVRCNPTRRNLGYADALRDQLLGRDAATDSSIVILDPTQTITTKGKKYTIKRVMDLVDIPPYNLLQIYYETMPQLPDAIALSNYVTRILPDIVLYCN